jgi:hypothetical protein
MGLLKRPYIHTVYSELYIHGLFVDSLIINVFLCILAYLGRGALCNCFLNHGSSRIILENGALKTAMGPNNPYGLFFFFLTFF